MMSWKLRFYARASRWFRPWDSIERAVAVFERTGDRYLDVEAWVELMGVSAAKAEAELEDAVRCGYLERAYLYQGAAPVRLVVSESDLDTTVALSDFGIFDEDDDGEEKEIFVSRHFSKLVYVSRCRDTGLHGQAPPKGVD